jgi:hypothetical protein
MNAFTAIQKSDAIRIFRSGISDAEYALRAKLQTMRNCASAMIAKTDSDTARALAWMCSEYVTAYIYASAHNDTLEQVAHFCHRLMVTAMQAEAIDDGAMS